MTEHPAICPRCGQMATRETNWTSGDIIEAAFMCKRGHSWTSKWLQRKGAA